MAYYDDCGLKLQLTADWNKCFIDHVLLIIT